MEGTSNATGVTPHGVRAGDPAALEGLVERRGPAVVAFTTLVCGRENGTAAAAEAMARFRAAVRDSPDLSTLDPETLLRAATRHASAAMARTPSGPPPHGRLRSRGTQTCQHVPVMLAARANGALGDADLDRLARHLDRCERCAAMSEIFRRAELAYADPPNDTLGTETAEVLLDGLQSVSAEGLGYAPPPTAPGELPTQITGALPTLPDLDDEIPLEPEHAETGAVKAAGAPDRGAAHDDADQWTYDQPAVAAAATGAEPTAPRRGPVRAIARFALPILVVVGAGIAALAGSGALDGDESTPPVRTAVATGIEAPVLTPLPVEVAAPAGQDETADSATTPDDTAATGAQPDTTAAAEPSGTAAPADAGTGAAAGSADGAGTPTPNAETGGAGAPPVEPGSADATGTTP